MSLPIPMTRATVKGRLRSCENCPHACEAFKTGKIEHSDPNAACPAEVPRWRAWGEVKQAKPGRWGLGDAVAAALSPAVRMIDGATAGTRFETKLKDCVACGQRIQRLNKAVPDVLRPFSG